MVSNQIVIAGRVQHVGFRFHAHDKALGLGLKGYVMNRPDGTVYCEVEGPEPNVAEFIAWSHRGPSWARVSSVTVTAQPICQYKGFEIRR